MTATTDVDPGVRTEALRSLARLGLRGLLYSMTGAKALHALESGEVPTTPVSPPASMRKVASRLSVGAALLCLCY